MTRKFTSPAPLALPLPDGPALRYRTPLREPSRVPAAVAFALALLAGADAQAGDILRGGATLGQRGTRGGGTSTALPQAADRARLNAKDSLARTTAAIRSVQAMQDAARVSAQKAANNLGINPSTRAPLPNVRDGLAPGGLEVAPGVPKNLANPQSGEDSKLWTGANLPKQQSRDGRTVVTIEQLKPRAVLNWKTFNVGKNTTLRFNQGRGGADRTQWIAFNKVNDPSGAPSQILGKIEGEGQAYVINRNGVIFGGSSQINLHTLAVSSLLINDNLIAAGLVNNPNSEYLFSAPVITDASVKLPTATEGQDTFTLTSAQTAVPGSIVVTSTAGTSTIPVRLTAGKDYTIGTAGDGRSTVTFTESGITKYSAGTATISYVNQRPGDIIVQKGAQITAPTTSSNVGGRVMLVGANVRNEGTISTPDGQTIIAAGMEVAVAAHPSSDATLRGLDVTIGRASGPTGVATNAGLIDTPRGNTTMAGREVNQLGIVSATTSVSLNGSVNLLANYAAERVTSLTTGLPVFTNTRTGTVKFGADSITQVVPELDSTKKVVGSELALKSKVTVQGKDIVFDENSLLLAPGASVSLQAGAWGKGSDNERKFYNTTGQIRLESGALISVAGTADVLVPVSQNILSLELRGAELADSPLQREGPLRATSLSLDIRKTGVYNGKTWVGTPLGDATGYANLIERSVGELTTAGGTVTMSAGGSVVMQAGSKVDVSGGFVRFEGGMVKTTRVMSDGRIVDISNATPDRTFEGIYDGTFSATFQKYSVTRTWTNPLVLSGEYFDPGYVEGRAGGSVNITAPAMVLDGELLGQTVVGPRQRETASAPRLSALSLRFEKQDGAQVDANAINTFATHSPTPPSITFGANTLSPVSKLTFEPDGDAAALPIERLREVILSPTLFTDSGFGSLTIYNADGSISIPEEVELKPRERGSLTFTAANIAIDGKVTSPGGSLSFTALNATPYLRQKFPIQEVFAEIPRGTGSVTVGPAASLNVSGLVVDDRPVSQNPLSLPLALDGGSIAIAGFNVYLKEGSSLEASGGVQFARDGRRTYGAGGKISVKAGNDPGIAAIIGGELQLDGKLAAFSGSKGGSLTVQAPSIIVADAAHPVRPITNGDKLEQNAVAHSLVVSPDFFNQGGFSSFTMLGIGQLLDEQGKFYPAVDIRPGITIKPEALSWTASPFGLAGEGARQFAVLQPEGVRTPVSLTFGAASTASINLPASGGGSLLVRGDVILREGAHVETDAKGSVTFSGGTVSILGSVSAPSGAIAVSSTSGATAFLGVGDASVTNVYLGPQSSLSTKGKALYTPNPYGYRTGSVLPGGTISIAGNIVADAGSVLDVSGAAAIIDAPPVTTQIGGEVAENSVVSTTSGVNQNLFTRSYVPALVESSAGQITLAGGTHLFSDATLLGNAGGPSALGGSLIISSGRNYIAGELASPLDVTLQVVQSGTVVPLDIPRVNGSAAGLAVPGSNVIDTTAFGRFAVEKFEKGGFDSLTLRNTVEFAGPVTINARRTLSVATLAGTPESSNTGGVIYADSPVTLNAPYVSLGTPFLPPGQKFAFKRGNDAFSFDPSHGTGALSVNATLIDVGTLSLQNIGSASLVAENGEIRGAGTFDVAGSIYLKAAQIYPPTAVTFTISAADYKVGDTTMPGSVVIEGSGVLQTPLSAGGQLNIFGSIINQSGTLRAPLGGITLGWDGSGTAPTGSTTGKAVATTQSVVLGAGSLTSVSAISSLEGGPLIIPYGINVNGVTWVDPYGQDITAGGVAQKTVSIAGQNVTSMAGSRIDIRGGGDLYAYRWVPGVGGSKDILSSASSFAVVPGYAANYAPYAPYNAAGSVLLGGDSGYVNSTLQYGDRIHLGASSGLPEGDYTLLPARYALMPGAFLVTPKSGAPIGTLSMPDGSNLVPGYRFNSERPVAGSTPQISWFEVLSNAAVRDRAEYADYYGNDFLSIGAQLVGADVPRLASDAGHLTLRASSTMTLLGNVSAGAPARSRAGLVDIASSADILITANGGSTPGKLVLSAAQLNSFGAESLLIGGIRQENGRTANVTVLSDNVTLSNAGTPLKGSEIILVANKALTLSDGAQIIQEGTLRGGGSLLNITGSTRLTGVGDTLDFTRAGASITFPNGVSGENRITATSPGTILNPNGTTSSFAAGAQLSLLPGAVVTLTNANATVTFASGAGSIPVTLGDGALVRVSSDASAGIVRQGVASTKEPALNVGAGVKISGNGVILDSTYATSLDPAATLDASAISLNSGQVSIQLENPGVLNPTTGLVLSGQALQSLTQSQSISLLSYSTIDLYGTGAFRTSGALALHGGAIRGFNNGGGTATISATSLTLDNSGNGASAAEVAPLSGTLELKAGTVTIGRNALAVERFANVDITASGGVLTTGAGRLSVQGDLSIHAPVITASRAADQAIIAGGDLTMTSVGSASVRGGFGASLLLQGASVDLSTDVQLASGILKVVAATGNLEVNNRLNLAGTTSEFYDLVRYTSGGRLELSSLNGSVTLGADSVVNLSAPAGGGNAGTLVVSTPKGTFAGLGELTAKAGAGGTAGKFSLDANGITNLSALEQQLVDGGFVDTQSFRQRSGDATLDGTFTARHFSLSTDQGGITVNGTINASGVRGGSIELSGGSFVNVGAGAVLNVEGQQFDSAGKGGSVFLGAGPSGNVSLDSGAQILLAGGITNNPNAGKFTGTLHIRAPRVGGTDVAVSALPSGIQGASAIIIEGYKQVDLASTAGVITSAVKAAVLADGNAFVGANDVTTPSYAIMANRLLGGNTTYESITSIRPGTEFINTAGAGNIIQGTETFATNAQYADDWNLSTYRFGPKSAPGMLTIRAGGNVRIFNSISDGFVSSSWDSLVMNANPDLPLNAQAWGIRLIAGADLSAADVTRVLPLSAPNLPSALPMPVSAVPAGSVIIGRDSRDTLTNPGNTTGQIMNNVMRAGLFQVVRTGAADIGIHARGDVQFRNQLSSVYTAGSLVANPGVLPDGSLFDVPDPGVRQPGTVAGNLGPDGRAFTYPAQYTLGGGNIVFAAQNDISHLRLVDGNLLVDSSREMPTNWLYRRSRVDAATGQFAASTIIGTVGSIDSTTWWVDFANFFEGVGTLGGGNISLTAGRDVVNVDAVAPTNARMPKGTPDASKLLELGGGDVTVTAGRNIDGGVYYVERGHGVLNASGEIKTNQARTTLAGSTLTPNTFGNPEVWLPTTLFVGKGSFDVTARQNVLLGPVANPFLMPEGYYNSVRYKTYFSTYSTDAYVNASSLSGDVTLRMAGSNNTAPSANLLKLWYNAFTDRGSTTGVGIKQPWLLSNETDPGIIGDYNFSLMPGTLRLTAISGNVNIAGSQVSTVTLAPAPSGTLEIVAAKSVNGLNISGTAGSGKAWSSTIINVSDASPDALPSVSNPYAVNLDVATSPLLDFSALFDEVPDVTLTLLQKQNLHAPELLHVDDPEPVRIYAGSGDISGLTVYSPKSAQILAGRDITDIAMYIQNLSEEDISVIAAGRDIVAYNPNSQRRVAASTGSNVLAQAEIAASGDIQIAGPGTLEVLAGGNLDLGASNPNSGAKTSGDGLGIVSVGNSRNTALPFDGAELFIGAGIGPAANLANSRLDFDGFVSEFLTGPAAERYQADLAELMGGNGGIQDFESLDPERRNLVALKIFYLILRDAGRDYALEGTSTFGNYDNGFAAIASLFPGTDWKGDLTLTSRGLKTKNGGDINVFVPGGKVVVGFDAGGAQALDQGILTESGGNIHIFANDSVTLGTSRIFTLRGGNEIIWSSTGDIAAGVASKTVQSAPPTRVLIDPASADVKTDLAGLATGGGIGVLTTVQGIPPGNVDLIAPAGAIDAGDAGIRSSGNLNVAAKVVLNAENIQVSGASVGAAPPAPPPAVVVSVPPPPTADQQGGPSASEMAKEQAAKQAAPTVEEPPSIITVEILGYGGGDGTPLP